MTIGQQTFVLDYCKCWRRKWQPTPVFLPGESHGLRSLGGYSLWGCKELDITSDWEPRIVNVLSLFGPQSSVIQGPQDSLFVYSLIVDPTRNILSWCVTRGLLQNPEAITCTLEYVYYVNHFLLWNWNLSFHLWKIMFLSIFFTAFKRNNLIIRSNKWASRYLFYIESSKSSKYSKSPRLSEKSSREQCPKDYTVKSFVFNRSLYNVHLIKKIIPILAM